MDALHLGAPIGLVVIFLVGWLYNVERLIWVCIRLDLSRKKSKKSTYIYISYFVMLYYLVYFSQQTVIVTFGV
jgi:hypothetical protein